MSHMKDKKKINAIKELRVLTSCGLKEAKDAVEDKRVTNMVEYMYGPDDYFWVSDLTDHRLS